MKKQPDKNEPSYSDKIRLEYLRYRDILYDKVAGLPTVPLIIESLRNLLDEYSSMGVIVIDLSKYGQYEKAYGWEKIDRIIQNLSEIVSQISKTKEWRNNIISVNRARGDDIILFITSSSRKKILDDLSLREFSNKLIKAILSKLDKRILSGFNADFQIHSGYSLIYNDPNIRLERLIYRGIKEASIMANDSEKADKQFKIMILKKIINNEEISVVFQPIVDIIKQTVMGYEALSRGPQKTEMENPEILFNIAAEGNVVWELERLCREKALSSFPKFNKGQYIFLNNEPAVIYDPRFQAMEILKKLNVSPQRVVLEITERTAIKNFQAFKAALSYFKSKGFKISIDDAGAGYASLKSIAMLNPDFIKFDINLIRNIDNNLIKRNLVQSLIEIAQRIKSEVIAEGVETKQEYETIRELGVELVQGFYLAKPAKVLPTVNFKKLSCI